MFVGWIYFIIRLRFRLRRTQLLLRKSCATRMRRLRMRTEPSRRMRRRRKRRRRKRWATRRATHACMCVSALAWRVRVFVLRCVCVSSWLLVRLMHVYVCSCIAALLFACQFLWCQVSVLGLCSSSIVPSWDICFIIVVCAI